MNPDLTIDREFESLIPHLTGEEFKQLEANILEAGEIYEPIVVWDGTIVDGHNRYRIALEHPEVAWTVREVKFDNKWQAFQWMCCNQLGRRNLTKEQRDYLVGKRYEAQKQTHGGNRGNQHTKLASAQNEPMPKGRAADGLAKELGLGRETVKRAEAFAKGIDAIRETDLELADSILNGKQKVKKSDVITVGKAKSKKRSEMIERIRAGKPVAEKKDDDLAEIEAIVSSSTDGHMMEFTIETLVEQIRVNAASWVGTLSNILMDHTNLCNENPVLVVQAIEEHLKKPIDQIINRLNDENTDQT